MQGVLVVLGMASPEVVVVVPAEEGENSKEKAVEPPGFEYRVVDQLVKAVDQKMPEVAIDDRQEDRGIPGPIERRVDDDNSCDGKDAQVAQRLRETEKVAALVELRQLFAADLTTVPLHTGLFLRLVVLRPRGEYFFVG